MSRKMIKGFTTLELLIILIIIGFFVAMLAPRLSQMFDDATTKISDMNKKDSMRFNRMWTVKHGPRQIGNNLINMVNYVGGTAANANDPAQYEFLSLAEFKTPEDGAEALSYQFVNRMKPYLHTLTQDEVDELDEMGLTHIYMADTDPDGATAPTAEKRFRIVAGMRVLMVGAGNLGGTYQCAAANDWSETGNHYVNGAAGENSGINDDAVQDDPAGRDASTDGGIPHTGSAAFADGIEYEDGIGYPDYMYRIMMAVGPDSTLVKDGVVDNEGISPDAISQGKHYRFNRYVVLLPRLQATVRAVTGRIGAFVSTAVTPNLFVGERTDKNGVIERNQWLVADLVDRAAQPFDEFDVISPEGYKVLDETLERLKNKTDLDGPSLWQTHANTIYDPTDGAMFQR